MFIQKTFFACWQEKVLPFASKNHEKFFLSGTSGTILEKKIEKIKSKSGFET